MTFEDVFMALRSAGLTPAWNVNDEVYAYVDGPQRGPVSVEWLLTFGFEGGALARFAIEKRLVGP